jgi:putative flippase GtrA
LSFVLNAKYNFHTTDRIWLRMASFFGVAALGLFVSDRVLRLLVDHWHQDKYLAKMATLVVVVALQYNLNRLLSFRKVRS